MERIIMPLNWKDALKNVKVDSINNDFILLENPVITSAFNYPFKVDVTTAIICTHGTMKGSIDLKPYHTQSPCLFIVLPDQILQYEDFSEDFSGHFIIMSKRFTDSLVINANERFPLNRTVRNSPCIPLREEELEAMLNYYSMMQRAVGIKDHPYRLEVATHLTQAFFYGAGHYFHKIDKENKSKQELLVEKFLNFVQLYYKEQRSLEFYADKMCLTPKYLSKVIKENSGESAAEWIDKYIILEAKALLKSTNLTIQQISDELNFPSQSFFGKYFKRNVGVSPKEYKKN